jgi:hypothetical protein
MVTSKPWPALVFCYLAIVQGPYFTGFCSQVAPKSRLPVLTLWASTVAERLGPGATPLGRDPASERGWWVLRILT